MVEIWQVDVEARCRILVREEARVIQFPAEDWAVKLVGRGSIAPQGRGDREREDALSQMKMIDLFFEPPSGSLT